MNPSDPWERLLVAGLARDFQQMRLEFLRALARRKAAKQDLLGFIETWASGHAERDPPVPRDGRARAGRAAGRPGDAGADRQPGTQHPQTLIGA